MNRSSDTGRPLHLEVRDIIDQLAPKYGEGEARAMARIIFWHLKGWTAVDLAIKANEPVSDFIHSKIEATVARLMADEPIQYIFGQTEFYGMKLSVTPDVLIPRPETAELVDIIVSQNRDKDLRVVDFGTGSGCIAIALSRNLTFPNITAVDNSRKALAVAEANAKALHAAVDFVEADMLALDVSVPAALDTSFDIIVSNPPYIAEREKKDMDANVLLHEPASALFVADADPLLFYKAIMNYAYARLTASGKVYFEINPMFADELQREASDRGFSSTEILRDTYGKKRFAIICR